MNLFFTYIGLVMGCWFVLLEPDLQLQTASQKTLLELRIENIWSALMVATFYTLPVVLAVCLPSQVETVPGRDAVRLNCNWVLLMPYMMHCLYGLGNSLGHIYRQLNKMNVFMAENFCRVLAKLILAYSLQIFCLLEIAVTVFYVFQILAMDGSRLY